MAYAKPSILIFEMNKKYLIFKILNKELKNQLRSEIWKNFGAKYVREKNEQSLEFYNSDQQDFQANDSIKANNNNNNFDLTDDLIYEYFSALVASFEISKEIDFVYEYALFNQNKYIIRFHQHKNFLIMVLFNNFETNSSESKNQLYAEYYADWFCKSIISLIKYKYGISTDDRCLKETDEKTIEIKSLFSRWSSYYQSENLYFFEAIEKLEVKSLVKSIIIIPIFK